MDENGFEYAKNEMEEPNDEANKVGRWIDDEVEEKICHFADVITVHVVSCFFVKVRDYDLYSHKVGDWAKVNRAQCKQREIQ